VAEPTQATLVMRDYLPLNLLPERGIHSADELQ
jgi:hypothetical protein